MSWLSSIKTKITILLLGVITLSLILAATLFITRLSLLQDESAKEVLQRAHQQTRLVLSEMARGYHEVSNKLAVDDNLNAALSLVLNYEDRSDYQAIIFDPPKQDIAATLEKYASGAGLDIAVIYDGAGEPVAFYLPTEVGAVSGYFQYLSGKPQMVYLSGQDVSLYPPLLLHEAHYGPGQGRMGKEHFHVADDNTIFYDLYLRLDNALIDAEAGKPFLRVGNLIDKQVMDRIAARAETGVHLSYDGGSLDGGTVPWIPESRELEAEVHASAQLKGSDSSLVWEEFRSGEETYIRGVTYLELTGEGEAVLSFVQDAQTFSHGVRALKEVLLVFLPLIALLLIPIGMLFANRAITVPVEKLMAFSSRLANGVYDEVAEIHSGGELSQLAETFNSMAGKLQLREEQLRKSWAQFEGIIDNAPAIIYMKDLDGSYQVVNNGFLKLLGKSEEQILGTNDYAHFPHTIAERFVEHDRRVLESGKAIDFEENATHPDGTTHIYHSVKFPLRSENGEVIALCGISTDITERKQTEQRLILARMVIENANEAIVITDTEGFIVDVNDAYERVTGFSRDEIVGRNPRVNKSGRHDKAFYSKMWSDLRESGGWEGEIWDRRKNGEIYPKWLSITAVADGDGEVTHYVGIFSDITSKKQTEEQLERLAYYDPLTSLPNRAYFLEQLRNALTTSKRAEGRFALMYLDLDRFKYVNDTLGHNAGDELLCKVADRLQVIVRESDTVSRLGGDEFTIILNGVDSIQAVSAIARKVVSAIADPFEVAGKEVRIGTSIGVSVYPDDAENVEVLIKNADLAMYQAKEDGRNNFHFYSEEMQQRLNRRVHLEEAIRLGLERHEFSVFYQPKVNIETGEVVGMESLLRWPQEDGSMISPAEFIPVAEETGLIVPLGQWVLTESCRMTALWNRLYGLSLKVAVNLSAQQFKEDVVAMVEEANSVTEGAAVELELEITESMVMENVEESIDKMAKIRALGVSLAIDDFGTGYSSLNYLKRFPINTLKIDQSFIRDLQVNSDDASIVRAIISMAHSLDLDVVAEGVESQEQLEFLAQHKCEMGQGFYLHRPMAADDFENLLATRYEVA